MSQHLIKQFQVRSATTFDNQVPVVENYPNLEKHHPFRQFSSKLSEFVFGKRSGELDSFFI